MVLLWTEVMFKWECGTRLEAEALYKYLLPLDTVRRRVMIGWSDPIDQSVVERDGRTVCLTGNSIVTPCLKDLDAIIREVMTITSLVTMEVEFYSPFGRQLGTYWFDHDCGELQYLPVSLWPGTSPCQTLDRWGEEWSEYTEKVYGIFDDNKVTREADLEICSKFLEQPLE